MNWDSLSEVTAYIVAWRQRKKFETSWFNVPEKLMLVVTELSEAMEAYRKLSMRELGWLALRADGLDVDGVEPEAFENFKEELADALIRLLDLCGSLGINPVREIKQKMAFNETRPTRHGKER